MRKINFQIELWLLMSAAMLLVLSSGCKRSQDAPPQPPPPPVVEVAAVIQKDVPIYSEWIGTLQGYVNAQIQPHVTGYLLRRHWTRPRRSLGGPGRSVAPPHSAGNGIVAGGRRTRFLKANSTTILKQS